MDFFEQDGVVYKHVPAGGHGGGITSSFPVKASPAEVAAFHAAKKPDNAIEQIVEAAVELEHKAEAAEHPASE